MLVVENPSIVAELTPSGVAVVCGRGWPNVAVVTLLRQLTARGVRLLCHADFDPSGLLITRHLAAHLGAEPWRMTSTDYEEAARGAHVRCEGSVPDTPWDPGLAALMRQSRLAVYEEQVRHELLAAAANLRQ